MKNLYYTMYILKFLWILILLYQFVVYNLSKDAKVLYSNPQVDYGYNIYFMYNDSKRVNGNVHTIYRYSNNEDIKVYKLGKTYSIYSRELTSFGILCLLLYIIIAFYVIPHYGEQSLKTPILRSTSESSY